MAKSQVSKKRTTIHSEHIIKRCSFEDGKLVLFLEDKFAPDSIRLEFDQSEMDMIMKSIPNKDKSKDDGQ